MFSVDDRDVLIAKGFNLLQSSEAHCMYVFENKCKTNFSSEVPNYVVSDILAF